MSSIKYDNDIVNNSVQGLNAVNSKFPAVASRVQSLTGSMMSCRGFGLIGSGVSSTSFSSGITESSTSLSDLITSIRQAQVSILAYSNDDKAIQVFLDSLSKNEYNALDLSGIESHIGVGRKITNGFKSLAATIFASGAGLVEGIAEFAETGADLVVLGSSAVKTIFTGAYDIFTGSNTTREMWEETKAYVSEKHVENAFNNFYNETEFGQTIKENAYHFDTVRGISSGLGYTAGLIGLNVVTGGLASGLGVGAAGSVGVGQLAATAGVMGFSSGTENAWADGASLEKGLMYGAATGAWEGVQWAIGAKINQYGGIGDQVASGIFKGGRAGAATRVIMDAADSGVEGFVQPALSMIYKDYEGNTLGEKYKNAFNQSGGWANVRNQAIMGGIMSAGSEFMDARKILKSNSNGTTEGKVPTSKAAGGDESVEYRTELASEDIFQREIMEDEMAAVGNYTKNRRSNIDGGYIKTEDTVFNTSTCNGQIPNGSVKFMDGSYVPRGTPDSVLRRTETYYDGSSFSALLESKKNTMSGYEYTRYKEAAEIFASNDKKFNLNELKLIVNHSEGNVNRIKSVIAMSESSLMPQDLDRISKQLSEKLFSTSGNSIGNNVERRIVNQFIDELQNAGKDSWKSGSVIMDDLYTTGDALKRVQSSTSQSRYKQLQSMNRSGVLSDTTMRQIVTSDGYPETIVRILKKDANISITQAVSIAETISSSVFLPQNSARIKAQYEIYKGNYDSAGTLLSQTGSSFDTTAAMFRASETFSQRAKRFVYYNAIDSAINMGSSTADAIKQTKLMYGYAMDQVGTASAKTSADKLFKSNSNYFGYDGSFISSFDSYTGSRTVDSTYMKKNYVTEDGRSVYRNKIVSDFQNVMSGKNLEADRPMYLRVSDVDKSKSVEAGRLFTSAYVDTAMKSSDPLETLKVMSKLVELEQNGTKMYVYNNGGKSGSHRSFQTINLANQTIDSRNAGTVFHETGHYLFGNVLNEKVPTGFDQVRINAEATLNSAANAQTFKTLKSNVMEVKLFADYKGTQALQSSLAKKGFSSIDAYKKHLVESYSLQSTQERASTLLVNTSKQGSFTTGSFENNYVPKFDFNDPLNCANLELHSMKMKAVDAVSRSCGSYSTITGMIDSLTKSQENIWYGHTREYFDGSSNPNLRVYHELIADYTALRVSGENTTIGLIRQLFGDELVNMLENTYQDMLK